jgi:hypothetical protein
MKGQSVKSNSIRPELAAKFKGRLKVMKDTEIRRLIINMLKQKALKESFVAIKIPGQSIANIMVYLIPGKLSNKLMNGGLRITMSDGV